MSMISHADLGIVKDEINKNDDFYLVPCEMDQSFFLQIFDNQRNCLHQFALTKEQAKDLFEGIGSALKRSHIISDYSIK